MNLIYIIFIIIIAFSLITGLIVTFAENREKKICSEIEEEIEEEEAEKQALSIQNIDNYGHNSISQVDNNYSIGSFSTENVAPVVPVMQNNNSFSTENAAPVVPVMQNNNSFSTGNAAPVVPVMQNNNSFSTGNATPVVPISQNSGEVYQTPINNSLESTLRVDSIEMLENTLELKIRNNDQFSDAPQLIPYSVVDDDII